MLDAYFVEFSSFIWIIEKKNDSTLPWRPFLKLKMVNYNPK